MNPILWLNIGLAVPFVLAFVGIPLWLTARHADTPADHSQARAYLAAKEPRLAARPQPAMAARRAA
jgi:hypothetical protein